MAMEFKTKIYEGGKRGGNMEHQPSGLIWALDNWIYITYESIRYRFTDGKLVTEKLPRGTGQWGLTQDDDGRLYYSQAGAEIPAKSFQQNPQYGIIGLRGELDRDFKKVYPIAPVPDVQGGKKRIGSSGGVNYFTGVAGQGIYRGNALPSDLYGDLFIPEPVGRLIRRAKVVRENGKTTLINTTPESEFIRSKDINFRPLQASTGPDGCLYIVDMHRGIIQQGNWTKPGSYLRGVIDKWGLDKNINRGRIYRLVHKDHKPEERPQLNSLKTEELLKYLNDSNGWLRDTAKRLIILREDRDSVIPALEKVVVKSSVKTQTRITTLWTLEGMSRVKPTILSKLLSDSDPRIVANAIRVSEAFVKKNDTTIISSLEKLANTDDAEIAIQLLNSISYVGKPTSLLSVYDQLMKNHSKLPAVVANEEIRKKLESSKKGNNKVMNEALTRGEAIYTKLCTECHGESGMGTPMAGQVGLTLAPSLKSVRVNGSGESLLRILLQGMQGPVDGKEYAAGIMPPQGSNDDQWIADVATYIRNNFGNEKSMITPEMVASIRKIDPARAAMWTQKELEEAESKEITNTKNWKLSASHNEKTISNVIDRKTKSHYSTSAKMVPDMWVQVELPEPVEIQQIVMECGTKPTDFPIEYTVSFSLDGKMWEASSTQKGTPLVSTFYTAATKARFIRITQTGKSSKYHWAIDELRLFGK